MLFNLYSKLFYRRTTWVRGATSMFARILGLFRVLSTLWFGDYLSIKLLRGENRLIFFFLDKSNRWPPLLPTIKAYLSIVNKKQSDIFHLFVEIQNSITFNWINMRSISKKIVHTFQVRSVGGEKLFRITSLRQNTAIIRF